MSRAAGLLEVDRWRLIGRATLALLGVERGAGAAEPPALLAATAVFLLVGAAVRAVRPLLASPVVAVVAERERIFERFSQLEAGAGHWPAASAWACTSPGSSPGRRAATWSWRRRAVSTARRNGAAPASSRACRWPTRTPRGSATSRALSGNNRMNLAGQALEG